MKTHNCPFIGSYPFTYDYCVAIKGKHECLCQTYWIYENNKVKDFIRPDVTECRIIQRVLRAFKNKEFEVIRHFYAQCYPGKNWEDFVKEYTGIQWKAWHIRLGKYLMEKCKQDSSCPYKPLLQ